MARLQDDDEDDDGYCECQNLERDALDWGMRVTIIWILSLVSGAFFILLTGKVFLDHLTWGEVFRPFLVFPALAIVSMGVVKVKNYLEERRSRRRVVEQAQDPSTPLGSLLRDNDRRKE